MIRSTINRRTALSTLGALSGIAAATCGMSGDGFLSPVAAQPPAQANCTLGFSTYGMKSLRTEDAVATLAKIGFDAVELTVWPDWDASPANLSPARRKGLRKLAEDQNIQICSLMEHITPAESKSESAKQLDRLKSVFDLANDLSVDKPPLVQTVLGGGNWKVKRDFLLSRLREWLNAANSTKSRLAIKPHRGGVVSRPSEAIWLFDKLSFPDRLGMVYDFSHYAFRDMTIQATISESLPYTMHVAVKDAVQKDGRVLFKLPGQAGSIDFATLIRQFHDGHYDGDINCEVSGMVWKQAGYDPIAAANQCYKNMSKAFQDAGVPRSA